MKIHYDYLMNYPITKNICIELLKVAHKLAEKLSYNILYN